MARHMTANDRKEPLMAYDKGSAAPLSDEDIKARLTEDEDFLTALQSGNLHLAHPPEGRREAKVADLQRQIAIWQSLLAKRRSGRARNILGLSVFAGDRALGELKPQRDDPAMRPLSCISFVNAVIDLTRGRH
jgi:hypothetical protein